MTQKSQAVEGGVRAMLRLEGFALLAAALLLYGQAGLGWKWFFILILAPDLAFAFYAFGARIGALAYNTTHSTIGPSLLAFVSQLDFATLGIAHRPALWPLALIWFAHVGFDRALGYGLKYASGSSDTHLGHIALTRLKTA
jgi:hypothetical protein